MELTYGILIKHGFYFFNTAYLLHNPFTCMAFQLQFDSKKKASKANPFKLSDRKNLYVLMHNNGSKYLGYKCKYNGKEKTLAIEVYPDINLAKVGDKHLEVRQQLKESAKPSIQTQLNTALFYCG